MYLEIEQNQIKKENNKIKFQEKEIDSEVSIRKDKI